MVRKATTASRPSDDKPTVGKRAPGRPKFLWACEIKTKHGRGLVIVKFDDGSFHFKPVDKRLRGFALTADAALIVSGMLRGVIRYNEATNSLEGLALAK